MPKKRNSDAPQDGGLNVASEEAQTRRISELAARRKKALEDLAEVQRMEQDLGVVQTFDPGDQDDQAAPMELSKIDRIMAELGGEGFFLVDFIDRGVASRCGQWTIDEYPDALNNLVREKGGGMFKVSFRRANGQAAGQFTQSFDKDIYGKDKPRAELQPNGSDMMRDFLTVMERRDEAHRRELNELRMEQTKLMTMMFQSIGQKTPMQDVVAVVKLLKDEGPKAKSALSEVQETVALLNSLKDEVEPASPLERALDRGLRLLTPILEAGIAKAVTRAQAEGPVPYVAPGAGMMPSVASPTALPAPRPEAALPPSSPQDAIITTYGRMLYGAVVKQGDPGTTARVVIDAVPDEQYDDFCDLVTAPNFAADMVRLAPELAPHKAWVDTFVATLKDIIESVEGAAMPTPTPTQAGENAIPAK